MRISIIVVLFFAFVYCHAADRTPEIAKKELGNAKADTVKIRLLIEIGEMYDYVNADSAIMYYSKALALGEKRGDKKLMAQMYKYIGIVKDIQGLDQETLTWYAKAEKLYAEIKDSTGLAGTKYNTGSSYLSLNNFPEAMKYYQQALRIYERVSNYPEVDRNDIIAYCHLNMGIIFEYQKDMAKAEEYYSQASEFFLKANDMPGYLSSLNNLGGMVLYKEDFKKALSIFKQAIDSCLKFNDLNILSKCYNNTGNVYYKMGDNKNARIFYDKSIEIKKQRGDFAGAAKSLINIGAIFIKTGEYKTSISYSEEAIKIGDSLKNYEIIMYASETFSKAYEGMGNIPKALEYYKMFKSASDSLINQSRNEKIEELTALFETEKKQLQIEKLEKNKALQEETIARKSAENKRQQQMLIFVIIGLVLMIAFSIMVYRFFLQKKKANQLLSIRNAEINQQKEEIEAQRDEIEAQRDRISEINQELTSSIQYASRIQMAVLPKPAETAEILGDYFLLYKPRNVVSGDFYWFTEMDNIIIAAVADCTGHGVPGALMSMMGIAFLREIVNHQRIVKPKDILEELRKNIILALQQKGVTGEQKDGMDFAIVAINKKTSVCTFAGANNSLYVVKAEIEAKAEAKNKSENESESEDSASTLTEIKGDRMPISIYSKMGDFTEKEIVLQNGDLLYLTSDGYADQFGGQNGKKYLSARFREKLNSVAHLDMIQQHIEMEKELMIWQGSFKQTDDITLLGIRYSG